MRVSFPPNKGTAYSTGFIITLANITEGVGLSTVQKLLLSVGVLHSSMRIHSHIGKDGNFDEWIMKMTRLFQWYYKS